MDTIPKISQFLNYINRETGFKGLIEFEFVPMIHLTAQISNNVKDCYLSLSNGQDTVVGDNVIDVLDKINREMTFSIPSTIKNEAEFRAITVSAQRIMGNQPFDVL